MTTIIYPGPYDVTHYEVYSRTGTTGDNLSNYLLDGQRYRMTAGGEHGHGLFLGGVVDAQYSNIEAVSCHGDGIYIGNTDLYGSTIRQSKNVVLRNVTVRNVRRNGIALVGPTGVTIDGFHIVGTNGISPISGIDLEPDPESLDNSGITLKNGWVEGCTNFGIISDTDRTKNVVIENTVVIASATGWALWFNVEGTENYVRDCTFIGPSTNLKNTVFERCTFVTLGQEVFSQSRYAIELHNDDPLKFRNCRFIGTQAAGAATSIGGANKDIDSSNVEILI